MSTPKYASFAVEDMKEGGSGLFDNVDATITGIQFTKEAPDNYTADGNPIFCKVSLELKGDQPAEERAVSQTYTLGASAGDNFTVSEDGYGLIPSNDDAAPRKDSKFGTFVCALQNEGLPKTVLAAGDFSKLIGLAGHFKRIADKERSFTQERQNQRKSKFPPSTLVCTKILSLPGDSVKGTPATKTTTKASTATTAPVAGSSSGDLDTDVWGYLETVLREKGGTEQRGRLTLSVSKAAMKDGNRQALARRASEESFIQSMVELGMVTYAASEKGQPVTLVQ